MHYWPTQTKTSKFIEQQNINTTPVTTTFVDNSTSVGETLEIKPAQTTIPIVEQSLKDFFAKPYLVSDAFWSTVDIAGVNKITIDPWNAINSNAQWFEKTRGYSFIRGTAVVTVVINATPFQQGRLLMHSLPDIQDFDTYNFSLQQKTQHNNVELDCRDSVAVLKLPYVAPTEWVNVYTLQTGETRYDWGRIYIDVLSPLNSIDASVVEITAYLHFEDFELAAPIVPQSGSKYRSVEEMERSTGMSLSAGLHRVSSVARDASSIPLISSYASKLSWAADVGSKLASAFGYSKPASDKPNSRVVQSNALGTHTCDMEFPGGRLALRNDNRVSMQDSVSIRKSDELSMEYLKSIESYSRSFDYLVENDPDDQIFDFAINPYFGTINGNVTKGAKTLTVMTEHPVARISRLFTSYRGSIRIKFKLIKTQFHTGRLQFAFTPGKAAVLPTIADILPLRQIVDITTTDEVVIECPYYFAADYLKTSQDLGRLTVRVVNQLKAPTTVAAGISILAFISFGDDFELAMPNFAAANGGTIVPVTLQSGDKVIDVPIGGQPARHDTLIYAERSVGEKFLSVRQLLMRFTRWFNSTALSADNNFIFPFSYGRLKYDTVSTFMKPQCILGADALSLLGPMYAYYRGGVRILVATTPTNSLTLCNTGSRALYTDYVTAAPNLGPTASVDWTIPASGFMATPTFTSNAYTGIHQAELPYYSHTRCSLVPLASGTALGKIPSTLDTPETGFIISSVGTLDSRVALSRAIAEDFQLSYFICTPPTAVSLV